MGETSNDCNFSLESTRCIGVCALAPVVTINDKVFSNVTATQVPKIIHDVKLEM
jgi:NADH:ubiquinone oxidoreductase subunit E